MTSIEVNQPPVDPLESLLIDAAEVDRTEIANTLRDLVAVDSSSGAVVFRPIARRLGARQKVLAYLLGRKVSHLLDKIEVEEVRPKAIIEDTGLASGTVHPTLKGLREDRAVSQDTDGAYFVATHQIQSALEMIRTEGDTT